MLLAIARCRAADASSVLASAVDVISVKRFEPNRVPPFRRCAYQQFACQVFVRGLGGGGLGLGRRIAGYGLGVAGWEGRYNGGTDCLLACSSN